ncbi:DegT/DnrJ/EryC1/StrS family aminotransferase [Kushneria aurantia]|uniref:DegT/DnrJ/EryC1/StrS family aminotransferase n=1 Tax=Kushneria aurantia TaxID=504092 RepID=A0ABV6G2F2_9GAMM|nr:DegT/DnrJ/EryC1/StrS family aminotransferase [Kushneria aurantia]
MSKKIVDCTFKRIRSRDEMEQIAISAMEADLLSGDSSLISEYEEKIKNVLGVGNAIAVSSGTAALHASVSEVIQNGDEVLVPVICVPMTVCAVIEAGGVPVFYDCQEMSFKPSLESLDKLSSSRTKALITVSMWGNSAIDASIINFARQNDWVVIEDAAQGLGTQNELGYEGCVGDLGCFSTHEFKLVSTGEGGFITTDFDYLYERIRSYTRIGFSQKLGGFGFRSGLNYKLSGLQALLGAQQLDKLEFNRSERESKSMYWEECLDGIQASVYGRRIFRFFVSSYRYNHYAACFYIEDPTKGLSKSVAKLMNEQGIGNDIHRYRQGLMVEFPFLRKAYSMDRYRKDVRLDFPNASRVMDGLITLPCHDEVSMQDIEKSTRVIKNVFK